MRVVIGAAHHIFGRTTNPFNCHSGGSLGGAGAFISTKGSPLNVRSEVGGWLVHSTEITVDHIASQFYKMSSGAMYVDCMVCGLPPVDLQRAVQ